MSLLIGASAGEVTEGFDHRFGQEEPRILWMRRIKTDNPQKSVASIKSISPYFILSGQNDNQRLTGHADIERMKTQAMEL